jgi:hypothetical protein
MTQMLALLSLFTFVMKWYSARRIIAEDVSSKRYRICAGVSGTAVNLVPFTRVFQKICVFCVHMPC